MSIRTLIVDDEKLARTRMARLLAADSEVQVCGECRNSREAEEFLSHNQIDVVFLDIQMPGESGFDLIRKIGCLSDAGHGVCHGSRPLRHQGV